MGIRMDQHMGLNEWATNFVQGEQVLVCMEEVTRVYPDGRRETLDPRRVFECSVEQEPSGNSYIGMFEDECPYCLFRYTFPNGQVYYEAVQTAPWSSGPVFFLALRDKDGNWVPESLWPEEAIESA